MPKVAAKLSCRLMDAAAKGLHSNITSNAVPRLVSGSLSRLKSGASSRQICMTQARTTDGVSPTMHI